MKHLLLPLTLVLALAACNSNSRRSSGPAVTETKKASTVKAEMLRAEIKMAAGELSIEGGGKDEVSAEFRYSQGSMIPSFRFDNTSFRARLVIEETHKDTSNFNMEENRWRVQLADNLATDLSVNMGAGEARLKLGSLDLRSVSLNIGAGKVVADFSGEARHDFEVKIRGGVGDCEVVLPKNVGIRAEARGGIGSLSVEGLSEKNGSYENAEYATAKVKIRLSIQGGVGSIRIKVA